MGLAGTDVSVEAVMRIVSLKYEAWRLMSETFQRRLSDNVKRQGITVSLRLLTLSCFFPRVPVLFVGLQDTKEIFV